MRSGSGAGRPAAERQGNTTADLCVFVPDLGGGGAERVMARLASAFAAEGLFVDLLCLCGSGPTASIVSPAVNVVDLACRMRKAVPRLVRHFRSARPSAFLVGYDHHCALPILAGRLSGVPMPIVATIHTNLSRWLASEGTKGRAYRLAVTPLLGMADSVVAVSQGVANDMARWSRRIAQRVRTVPNPVLPGDLNTQASPPSGHPWLDDGDTPVVLGVGRFAAPKDWMTLVYAVAMARKSRDVRLVLLGDGPDRPRVQEAIDSLGLRDAVCAPGWVDNPYPFIARASLLVHSSVMEGLPTAIIEAMGLSTPVICTECGQGARDILDNGRWGKIIPARDRAAMSAAILSVLAQRPNCSDATQSAWARYSVTAALDAYRPLLASRAD